MPRGADLYDEARLQGRLWDLRQGNLVTLGYRGDAPSGEAVSSGRVTQWTDWASGRNLVAGAGNYPLVVPNGVKFDDPGFGIFDTAPAISTSYDFVVVSNPNDTTSSYRTLLLAGPSRHPLLLETGTAKLGTFDGAMHQAGSYVWSGLGIVYAQITGTNTSMSLNGGALQATGANLTGTAAPIAVGGVASSLGGGQYFGTAYEMAFISAGRSQAEVDRIIGSLAWRWDKILGGRSLRTQLPASHPYKNRPPLIGA